MYIILRIFLEGCPRPPSNIMCYMLAAFCSCTAFWFVWPMLCTCVKLLHPHIHAQWLIQASIWGSSPTIIIEVSGFKKSMLSSNCWAHKCVHCSLIPFPKVGGHILYALGSLYSIKIHTRGSGYTVKMSNSWSVNVYILFNTTTQKMVCIN